MLDKLKSFWQNVTQQVKEMAAGCVDKTAVLVTYPVAGSIKEQVASTEPKLYDDAETIVDRIIHAMAVNNHTFSDISRLEVLCNNIEDYIQLLHDTCRALQGEQEFPKEALSLRLVKVCNFYRGRNGVFMSIPIMRGKMLDAMLMVVVAHQKARALPTAPGWLMYALSRATTVIINIDTLSNQLVVPRSEAN